MENRSDGKPCRSCTDFKTWAKLQKKTFESEQSSDDGTRNVHDINKQSSQASANAPKECPLDKDELGHSTWKFLHTMAAYYPDNPSVKQKKDMETFFHILSDFYPCKSCSKDLKDQLKTSAPKTNSQYQLSQWLCKIHNEINKKLGKDEFNCKLVDQRWRDGWIDGSCD